MYLPLNRQWSKRLALILIAAGILMMPDVIAPTPFMDLIINVPLAMLIASAFQISYLNAFLITYFISFLLVFAGLLIYPYNTVRLMNGKLKAAIRFMLKNPIMVIFSIFGLILVYLIGQYLYDAAYQEAVRIMAGVIN